jgi:hypothetical protein
MIELTFRFFPLESVDKWRCLWSSEARSRCFLEVGLSRFGHSFRTGAYPTVVCN